MSKRILINALYPEEKRVAIVEGDRLIDFYVEVAAREQLKGNIYKGVVVRVEPGLQAAFVDFGQKKHGFLQMRELQPEYYHKGKGKEKDKEKKEGRRPRIQDVLVKGQELIVQVEKDERDTKGASLTTYISLPGRFIVMMPGQERMIGISRKIEGREDRERLKGLFSSLKLPKNIGFILRTASGDTTSEELDTDLKYLTKLWNKIKAESKKAAPPALIYKEHDIAVKTVRDYLTSDVAEVLVDDAEAYRMIKDFLRKTMPGRKVNIKHYRDRRPIFSSYAIEEQIAKINERFVSLPSQGYIVFDRTEALTAIDVNSGRSRKEEHIEATAFRTNLEAADEVARQLRMRDIGGLVIIDFIDMESSKNRREVERRFRNALSTDKAHFDITGISRFGIVEMTRERLRTAYADSMTRSCPLCGGAGVLKADDSLAIAALRDMHNRAADAAAEGTLRGITCRLPVESANYLINSKRADILELEKSFGIAISVIGDTKLSPGQFSVDLDLQREAAKGGEAAVKETKEAQPCPPQPRQQAKQTGEVPEQEREVQTKDAAATGPEAQGRPSKRSRRRGRRSRDRRKKEQAKVNAAGSPAESSAGNGAGGADSGPEANYLDRTVEQFEGQNELQTEE